MEIEINDLKLIENNLENNYYIILLENSIGKLLMMSGSIFEYIQKYSNIFFINNNLNIFSNLELKGYSLDEYRFLNIDQSNIISININDYKIFLKDGYNFSSIYNYIFNEKLEYISPKIILSDEEKRFANQFKGSLNSNKKILIIHPFSSTCESGNYDPYKKSFRDYFTKDLINRYKEDYTILQIHNDNQCHFDNTVSLSNKTLREIVSIISISDKIISCDTITPHISAGLNIKSLVLWSITNEKLYGHPIHNNYRERELDDYIQLEYNIKKIPKIPPIINMFTEKTFNVIEDYLNEWK